MGHGATCVRGALLGSWQDTMSHSEGQDPLSPSCLLAGPGEQAPYAANARATGTRRLPCSGRSPWTLSPLVGWGANQSWGKAKGGLF